LVFLTLWGAGVYHGSCVVPAGEKPCRDKHLPPANTVRDMQAVAPTAPYSSSRKMRTKGA
jgi:hypothetical protein